MIVEYIRYQIEPGQQAEFEAAYQRAAVPLAAAPQCVDYELSACEDEPTAYVLRITWTSRADHLDGFRTSDAFRAFFAEIGPYVGAVQEMRHYTLTGVRGTGAAPSPTDGSPVAPAAADPAAAAATPTLYAWAGGEAALTRLFEVFYARVVDDELLAPLFAGMDPEHPRWVALWLGEVFGGPARYTGERGGYPHMLGRHLGRAITEPQRRRWVSLLLDAADAVDLPDDPEFRAALAGYLEWGTRIAVTNSQPDVDPVRDAPIPHWGWGVAPPWLPDRAPRP